MRVTVELPNEAHPVYIANVMASIGAQVGSGVKSGEYDGCEWVVADSTVADDYAPSALAPEEHPSRAISPEWLPRPAFRANLRVLYPEVDLRESYRRFVDFHLSRKDTSRSWEASFRAWVSRDHAQIMERRGGTDDLGVPRTQRAAFRHETTDEDERMKQELIDLARRSALEKTEQPDV